MPLPPLQPISPCSSWQLSPAPPSLVAARSRLVRHACVCVDISALCAAAGLCFHITGHDCAVCTAAIKGALKRDNDGG
jgi:hypothetical protein